ncbi:MAG: hypothetical protein QM760_01395 [Nibricoccus sp.]
MLTTIRLKNECRGRFSASYVSWAAAVVALFFAPASALYSANEETGHIFPLMKDLVKERPALPPPYGVAAIYTWVDSDWTITSARVGIDDANVPAEFAANTHSDINITTAGLKGDIWILPFFNMFLVGGKTKADITLNFTGVPIKFIPPGIGRPAEVVRGDVIVDFSLDGDYVTIGGVLAGGYKKFFASVDFSATEINFGHKDLVHGDQDVTFSIAPRLGYVVGLSQVWIGGRYFDYSSSYGGTIPLSGGGHFSFDVNLESTAWNLSAGMRTVLKGPLGGAAGSGPWKAENDHILSRLPLVTKS